MDYSRGCISSFSLTSLIAPLSYQHSQAGMRIPKGGSTPWNSAFWENLLNNKDKGKRYNQIELVTTITNFSSYLFPSKRLFSDCDYAIGVAAGGMTDVSISSSSNLNETFSATNAKLKLVSDVGIPGTGWISAEHDENPTLILMLGDVYIIRALVTQGCGEKKFWVKGYCISYAVSDVLTMILGSKTPEECKV